jgi:hypothetical protein
MWICSTSIIPPKECILNMLRVSGKVAIQLVVKVTRFGRSKCREVIENVPRFLVTV